MKITFKIGETIVQLPFVQEDAVSIDYGDSTNENKDSSKYGPIKVLGSDPLIKISIDSFFPGKAYGFTTNFKAPDEYIDFFETNRIKHSLFRIVITDRNEKEIINALMACESFSHKSSRRNGDVNYSLSFEEYRMVK